LFFLFFFLAFLLVVPLETLPLSEPVYGALMTILYTVVSVTEEERNPTVKRDSNVLV
jgi:hypothetical protein